VKTRLAASLGQEAAADLARAFLVDTWELLAEMGGPARPVLALAGELGGAGLDSDSAEVWPQGGGDLGARIERGLRRALVDAPWAIAVGTDSPGLPRRLLIRAMDALSERDAVIGPCDDGGFYLLGLRRCPEGLLDDLPWSEATTFEATRARLRERGLDPLVIEPWFDVDRPEDLDRLASLLGRGAVKAHATEAALARLARASSPRISVVIPAWCEAGGIEAAARSALAVGDEVIVADAGSPDETALAAARGGARVVQAPKGRGSQQNAGAKAARGEALLFLHADARLPPEARPAILEALSNPMVIGGSFRLRFEPATRAARFFTWGNDARHRALAIYYGDSAVFVRRTIFEALGGFQPFPIFEDFELIRRLERLGRMVYLRDIEVTASSRRFERAPVRTLLLWASLQTLYSVGVPPSALARLYADKR
jgi:rSAM/selenodomain-associated transferase 2/rSAM/selenodomain-associated transferase 1